MDRSKEALLSSVFRRSTAGYSGELVFCALLPVRRRKALQFVHKCGITAKRLNMNSHGCNPWKSEPSKGNREAVELLSQIIHIQPLRGYLADPILPRVAPVAIHIQPLCGYYKLVYKP